MSKKRQKVVYSFFLECSQWTLDPYWQAIFEKMTSGKFPRGFTFKLTEGSTNSGILTYKKGTRTIKLEIGKDAQEDVRKIIAFYQTNGGIFSATDQQKFNTEAKKRGQIDTDVKEKRWTDIKKKKVKKLFLLDYVGRVAKAYNLTDKERKYLIAFLNLGFFLGYLRNTDVTFEDGAIQEISGVVFDEKNRKFYFRDTKMRLTKTTKKKDYNKNIPKTTYLTLWSRYLGIKESSGQRTEQGSETTQNQSVFS